MFVIDNIAKVGKLELLKDILRDSIITKQVLEEFNLGIERGILALCVKTDVLTLKEADQILRAMIKSGFYSPNREFRESFERVSAEIEK